MSKPLFPTLETPRLHLRELRYGDAQLIYETHQDAQHMRYWGRDVLERAEEAFGIVAEYRARWKWPIPEVRWGLERKSDGFFLGTCNLCDWDQGWQRCKVNYSLCPAALGQGFMREALQTVLAWGFARGHLHRVEALIHPDNHASLGLAQRLGFQVEGRLREAAYWNNSHHDMFQLGLLQHEFTSAPIINLEE